MSWAESMKATALAALAERTSTAAPNHVDTRSRWNPHDIWLTRINQPRNHAGQSPDSVDRRAPHSGLDVDHQFA